MLPCSVELLLSVAEIVKLAVPVVVGVPLKTPAFSVSHDGKVPEVTAKVYAPEPPVALNVARYALFAVALVSVAGLTVRLLAEFTVSI